MKNKSHVGSETLTVSKPKLSKGERKGWVKISDYKSTPLNNIEWKGQHVKVYAGNRFGLPKLVP